MPGASAETPYDITGQRGSAALISQGAQGKGIQNLVKTDGLPRGTGSASAAAASSKNAEILASQVLNLRGGFNKSANKESREEDEEIRP